MTSWTDDQLKQLRQLSNHKVVSDISGEYNWMHNITGKWEVHSVKVFEDQNTAYSWLYFWIDKWGKELDDRFSSKLKQDRRKLKSIKRSKRMTNKEKIQSIRTLMTNYTMQEIANELSVSASTVKRSIRQMT
tara:strand:- start:335 stop:730 length:396 start_codon:yes stop_codon:yes gene_type:complete